MLEQDIHDSDKWTSIYTKSFKNEIRKIEFKLRNDSMKRLCLNLNEVNDSQAQKKIKSQIKNIEEEIGKLKLSISAEVTIIIKSLKCRETCPKQAINRSRTTLLCQRKL